MFDFISVVRTRLRPLGNRPLLSAIIASDQARLPVSPTDRAQTQRTAVGNGATPVRTERIISASVDSLPQIVEDTRGRTPNVTVVERNGVDAGDQSVPFRSLTLIILRCHQENERHFKGVVNLVAAEAKRKALAHARDGGHDAVITGRYMDVKIADRLNKVAVKRDLLLGLTQQKMRGAPRKHYRRLRLPMFLIPAYRAGPTATRRFEFHSSIPLRSYRSCRPEAR